jgi:hypothetical protein
MRAPLKEIDEGVGPGFVAQEVDGGLASEGVGFPGEIE